MWASDLAMVAEDIPSELTFLRESAKKGRILFPPESSIWKLENISDNNCSAREKAINLSRIGQE